MFQCKSPVAVRAMPANRPLHLTATAFVFQGSTCHQPRRQVNDVVSATKLDMSQAQETEVIRQRCAESILNKRAFFVTEAEWLACRDPWPLLESLRGKVSDRKLTLFSVACYRRIWHLADGPCRKVVEAVERLADDAISEDDVAHVYEDWVSQVDERHGQMNDGMGGNSYAAIPSVVGRGVEFAEAVSDSITSAVAFVPPDVLDPVAMAAELAVHAALVRDLFGNPFRAVNFDAVLAPPGILDLCETIIREQRFERMPILGEALWAAGCRDEAILAHCRETAGHVRGCWVLDYLVNKQ